MDCVHKVEYYAIEKNKRWEHLRSHRIYECGQSERALVILGDPANFHIIILTVVPVLWKRLSALNINQHGRERTLWYDPGHGRHRLVRMMNFLHLSERSNHGHITRTLTWMA